jgi:hypothetical protein
MDFPRLTNCLLLEIAAADPDIQHYGVPMPKTFSDLSQKEVETGVGGIESLGRVVLKVGPDFFLGTEGVG